VALADEVIARYSTAHLQQITNPQAPEATSYDATKLARACTDVEAEFAKIGLTFDVTVASHVVTAVEGVVALLKKRLGQVDGWNEWRDWREVQLERLRMVTTNDRITPTSNSKVYPRDENPSNDTELRPDYDDSNFDNFVPNAGRVNETNDFTSDNF
jgi:hypothetical protein